MAKADDEVLAMLPWMVRDWLSSRARAVLSHAQRSVYRELMDHAWLSPGCTLPDSDAVLAALADVTLEDWKELRPLLLSLECFTVTPSGLVNVKLRCAWLKSRQLRADKQRQAKKAGLASARARGYGQPRPFNARSTSVQRPINPPSPSPSPSPSSENVNGNGLPSEAIVPAQKRWTAEAIDDHRELRGEPKAGKLLAALKPLVDRYGWAEVRPVWRAFLESDAGKYGPHNFAENFLALRSPPARPPPRASVGEQAMAEAAKFLGGSSDRKN